MAEEMVDGKKGKKKGGAKDYKNLTGRQKAAIFLVAVGSDVASDVMKHLREDEVETLTFEIARLDTIDADFKDQVLEEFQELMQAQNFITTGGIDFTKNFLDGTVVKHNNIFENEHALLDFFCKFWIVFFQTLDNTFLCRPINTVNNFNYRIYTACRSKVFTSKCRKFSLKYPFNLS